MSLTRCEGLRGEEVWHVVENLDEIHESVRAGEQVFPFYKD